LIVFGIKKSKKKSRLEGVVNKNRIVFGIMKNIRYHISSK